MLLYKRYLLNRVTGYFFVIATILICLIWFTRAISFIKYITEKGIGISSFLYLFVLILPWLALLIIPISLFIAILACFGRMNTSNEITILKSSGLDKIAIAKPVIYVALMLTIFCYTISFYLMPLSNKNLRIVRKNFQHNYANILISPGIFESLNDLTIYVKKRYGNNQLSGILLFDNYNKNNAITLTAQDGDLIENNGSILMRLKNGTLQKYNPVERTSQILNFDSYIVNLSQNQKEEDEYTWKASERYIGELLYPDKKKKLFPGELDSFRVELHQRLTIPLFSVILALIACGYILKGEFNRKGNYMNNIYAVFVAGIFIGITMASYNLMEKRPAFAFLLYANFLFFTLFSFYLLKSNFRLHLKSNS